MSARVHGFSVHNAHTMRIDVRSQLGIASMLPMYLSFSRSQPSEKLFDCSRAGNLCIRPPNARHCVRIASSDGNLAQLVANRAALSFALGHISPFRDSNAGT